MEPPKGLIKVATTAGKMQAERYSDAAAETSGVRACGISQRLRKNEARIGGP